MKQLPIQSNKPAVAILTSKNRNSSFVGNRELFSELSKISHTKGLYMYVLPIDNLIFGKKRLKGFVYHAPSKRWIQKTVPFPQVIYNRIPTRRLEQMPEAQERIQQCLNYPNLTLFNPSFFDKWTLITWLQQSSTTNQLIPETKQFGNIVTLHSMVKKYKNVYLKPVRGKAGNGIMRIDRLRTKKDKMFYLLTTQNQQEINRIRFTNPASLFHKLEEEVRGRSYIIQQGISLVKYRSRPFDLRVLMQKNKTGEWKITGIGSRVAGESSITTHVPRGGSIQSPKRTLVAAFGLGRAKSILMKLKVQVLQIALQIEQASGYELGELSMDIGVDKNGKLWFFEANSKPMKFDEKEIRTKSLRRIVGYCKYLVEGR